MEPLALAVVLPEPLVVPAPPDELPHPAIARTPTVSASAGLTREVIEISNATHFPLRVLGYQGSTLVRKIDFVDVKLTR